jgi:hypothetical protein
MLAAFQSVLESDNPTSIAAISESNAFLVHCESKLYSYRLDHIISVSQGDTGPKNVDGWETRLASGHGDILFFKAGHIGSQTLSKKLVTCCAFVVSHLQKLSIQRRTPNKLHHTYQV